MPCARATGTTCACASQSPAAQGCSKSSIESFDSCDTKSIAARAV